MTDRSKRRRPGRVELERPPTLVIGVGSPLMRDDGLGLVALEMLRSGWTFEPRVELLDGGTWGLSLLPFLERARYALILDAIDAAGEPGTLWSLEGAELPRFLGGKVSPHQIDLREVLALAALRGRMPEHLVALGLQPARVELGSGLTAEVAHGLPALLDAAVERLEAWGHAATRLPPWGRPVSRTEGRARAGLRLD